jgi:hypothetical protein
MNLTRALLGIPNLSRREFCPSYDISSPFLLEVLRITPIEVENSDFCSVGYGNWLGTGRSDKA